MFRLNVITEIGETLIKHAKENNENITITKVVFGEGIHFASTNYTEESKVIESLKKTEYVLNARNNLYIESIKKIDTDDSNSNYIILADLDNKDIEGTYQAYEAGIFAKTDTTDEVLLSYFISKSNINGNIVNSPDFIYRSELENFTYKFPMALTIDKDITLLFNSKEPGSVNSFVQGTRVERNKDGSISITDNYGNKETIKNSKFFISMKYYNKTDMERGYYTDSVKLGEYVTLDEGPETSIGLYIKEESGYEFVTDICGPRQITIGAHPKDTVYLSVSPENPSKYFGGKWKQIAQGRVLIGAGSGTDSNNESIEINGGETGGEYRHSISLKEMPQHNHNFKGTSKKTEFDGDHIHHIDADAERVSDHTHALEYAKLNISSPAEKSFLVCGRADTLETDEKIDTTKGGAHTHKIDVKIEENGNHSHSYTPEGIIGETGESESMPIMQPYLGVYIWQRIE